LSGGPAKKRDATVREEGRGQHPWEKTDDHEWWKNPYKRVRVGSVFRSRAKKKKETIPSSE